MCFGVFFVKMFCFARSAKKIFLVYVSFSVFGFSVFQFYVFSVFRFFGFSRATGNVCRGESLSHGSRGSPEPRVAVTGDP